MNRTALILIDVSASMNEPGAIPQQTKIMDARKGSIKFLRDQYYSEEDHVGLYSFSTSVSKNVNIAPSSESHLDDLKDAIEHLQCKGYTALWDSIELGMDELNPHSRSSSCSMIVLTDGNDNSSNNFPRGKPGCSIIMERIKRSGLDVRLYIIGVGDLSDEDCLTRMCSSTGGEYIKATREQIKEGFSAIGHRVAKGDALWGLKRRERIGGGMEWSREHGIDLDHSGMVTGKIVTPSDIFTKRISHEKAVACSVSRIHRSGGDPVIGKIPKRRKLPVDVDIYEKNNDEIIVVVEGPITPQIAGKALARISATRSEYEKNVKVYVVSYSDDPVPDFFSVACESLDTGVIVVGIQAIITGGVKVKKDDNGDIVADIDEEIRSISNIVPGTPGGEFRENLIVIPEMKPSNRIINSIEDLDLDHDVLHRLEVLFDPREFMDSWNDALMICQNLKRAAVHAIRGNEIGKNRNVFVFWSKERWESVVQDFRCWIEFKRVMEYLKDKYNTHFEVILYGDE